jgi:hypothetical protein
MKNNEIRKVVREILSEIEMAIGGGGWDSNNDVAQFVSSPYGQFPYLYVDKPEMLPSVADLKSQNNNDFEVFNKNNEVYNFPYEQFKNGMEIEMENQKKEGKDIHFYDIAHFVINNLQKDKNLYILKDGDNNQGNNEE